MADAEASQNGRGPALGDKYYKLFRNAQTAAVGGGSMTGRPRRHAGIVEECLRLDVRDVVHRDDGRQGQSLCVQWTVEPFGVVLARGQIACETLACVIGAFRVSIVRTSGDAAPISQQIALETTRPYFGGARTWFRCPVQREGRECGARARVLYLPFGADEFGCRACHELTYTSCRVSHRYDALWRALSRLTQIPVIAHNTRSHNAS